MKRLRRNRVVRVTPHARQRGAGTRKAGATFGCPPGIG
ncbi:hypothetical protein L810_2825 [Burkholderia sp. AU4i]|nr:hypothetical protein L810_2825 [Burkholderia sp. AU4i]